MDSSTVRARLAGRKALIVGGGAAPAGVTNGQAVAQSYAREGAAVVVADIDPAAAERTCRLIEDDGNDAVPIEVDVTDEAQVAAAVARATEKLGGLDLLHNNVGIVRQGGPVELPLDDWYGAFATNFFSVVAACRHAIPHLLAAGGGSIVNVSSIAAVRDTGYYYPSYSASKASVNQLTASLASRYAAEGIRVNAIMPGLLETPMIHRGFVGADDSQVALELEKRHAASPTGRMGTAWDVASAATFLASDEAQYITGVCLPVDGGLSLRTPAPEGAGAGD